MDAIPCTLKTPSPFTLKRPPVHYFGYYSKNTGGALERKALFLRCTLFFRKLSVVPYKHPLSEKFSKPCTLHFFSEMTTFLFRIIALSQPTQTR